MKSQKVRETLQARGVSSGGRGHREAVALRTATLGRDLLDRHGRRSLASERVPWPLLFRAPSVEVRATWRQKGPCHCGPLPHGGLA